MFCSLRRLLHAKHQEEPTSAHPSPFWMPTHSPRTCKTTWLCCLFRKQLVSTLNIISNRNHGILTLPSQAPPPGTSFSSSPLVGPYTRVPTAHITLRKSHGPSPAVTTVRNVGDMISDYIMFYFQPLVKFPLGRKVLHCGKQTQIRHS